MSLKVGQLLDFVDNYRDRLENSRELSILSFRTESDARNYFQEVSLGEIFPMPMGNENMVSPYISFKIYPRDFYRQGSHGMKASVNFKLPWNATEELNYSGIILKSDEQVEDA